jgi:hypothetical protein
MEVNHFEALLKGEHARREAERRRLEKAAQQVALAAPVPARVEHATADRFAIALFAGIDRPTVERRTVSLDELRQMLGKFEVLGDKRRGRCWSPTKYADGAMSRDTPQRDTRAHAAKKLQARQTG